MGLPACVSGPRCHSKLLFPIQVAVDQFFGGIVLVLIPVVVLLVDGGQ